MDGIVEFATFINHDFINLFWIPLGTVLLSVLCRYGERHDVFRSLVVDAGETSEAQFDILRVGPDLVLVAMTAVVGVIDLAWSLIGHADQNRFVVGTGVLAGVELACLLAVILLHLLHRYPQFARGVVLPNVVGFVAVCLSAAFFRMHVP